jgi:hypothetical protein
MTLFNCTVSNNVGGQGGGIQNNGTMTVTSCTITGNQSLQGAGIDSGGQTELKNTVIAGNLDGGDCSGILQSNGHNIDSDGTCNLTHPNDLSNTDPLLGPLADNGGPTLTHGLLAGSPAIDAGSLDCPPPARDQRGYGRPVDGDSDDQAICDIGAFEFGAVPLTRPTNLLTTVGDANGNSSADYAVTTLSDDNVGMYWQDGADGSAIGEVDLGDQELRLLETLADISGNGLDEVMTLTIANDQKRIVRLFDSGHGMPIRQLPFGRGAHYPIALLALDNADGGLAGRAVAVVQPDDEGRARAIVRDALTGEKIKTVRYGLTIGTPIGAVRIADLSGNAVEEIAVFGETTEGQAKVQIRDALSGEKLATFGFDRHFRPMLVGSIPPVNGDDSDELVVVGVNDAGAVRIEVKDSLTKQRLTTRWLRRIEEEIPLAMGYVDHPEGPALTILTEGADGKYRGRTKRLTSTEAGWLVDFPPHITPRDFAVMDDTSGNQVPELLVVGENRRGIVKALARDAETGEELFRTNVP